MGKARHEDWREQVESFHKSGLTQRKWCELSGMNLHNLNYWLRKDRNCGIAAGSRDLSATWMPLQIVEGPNALVLTSELQGKVTIRIGDIGIDVEPGFSVQHLLQVLHTVRAL